MPSEQFRRRRITEVINVYFSRSRPYIDRFVQDCTARSRVFLSDCRYIAHSVADLSWDQVSSRMYVVPPSLGYLLKLSSSLAYHDEEEKALRFIRESTVLSNEEKRRFFKSASANFGTSALCLSGGASFGYCTYFDSREYCYVSSLNYRSFGNSEGIP